MAQYKVYCPDDLIVCPYDEVHMILAKRMPYHLMKCRRNWAGNNYVRCPFNARHEVPKPEMKYHIATCVDRVVVEKDLLEVSETNGRYFKGCTTSPPIDDSWMPPPEEDWDREHPCVVRMESPPLQSDLLPKPRQTNTTSEPTHKYNSKTNPTPTEDWDKEASRCNVNLVDKSIFHIPKRHSVCYERMSIQDKRAVFDRLTKKGIEVDMTTPSADTLRLPHKPAMVLAHHSNQTIPQSQLHHTHSAPAGLQDLASNTQSHARIELGASLLKSMARGRGIMNITPGKEPQVGSSSTAKPPRSQ